MYKKAIIKQNKSCVCTNVDDTLPADNIFCIVFLVKPSDKPMIMIPRQNIELLNLLISDELHNFDTITGYTSKKYTIMHAGIMPREKVYENNSIDINAYINAHELFDSSADSIVSFVYRASSEICYIESTNFLSILRVATLYPNICKLSESELTKIIGCINTVLNDIRLNNADPVSASSYNKYNTIRLNTRS